MSLLIRNYTLSTEGCRAPVVLGYLAYICRLFLFFVIAILLSCLLTAAKSHAVTLEECIEQALENNPDLQKQQMNLQLAHEDMAEQKSRNFGTLDFVSAYTHYNLPRTLAPLTPGSIFSDPAAVATTEDLFGVGVVYEVVLFTGFTQTRSVEVSALEKELAGAALKLSREQLVYNVKTLYINILAQQAQVEAQISYIAALQRLHDDITREMQLGKKARIDQLKAAADLKNSQARLEQIAGNVAIMKGTLASLLNVDTLTDLQGVDLVPETIAVVTEDFSGQFTTLQRMNTARLATRKTAKLVEKSQGALYPRIVFSSSYGQNFGPNDSSNKYSGDWENQEVWQAGVNLRWSIFDFGGNSAKVQKARVLERQSRYEQTKVELELKRALQEAVTKINMAVSDYTSAREELAMTRETEAIEQVRFEQGAADINDLLYAKARNQLALSRFIGAGFTHKIALFYLDYLLENGEKR